MDCPNTRPAWKPRSAWQRFCDVAGPIAMTVFVIGWFVVLGCMVRTGGDVWEGEAEAWMRVDELGE